MNRKTVGFIAIGALLVAAPLMAQQRQGRGFGRGGFGGVTKALLLRNEDVQKELDLVDDQKEQLGKIAEEGRGGRGGRGAFNQDATPEERAKALEELRARQQETEKKVEAVLTAPQKTRLNEIWLQAAGTAALSNPEIAKELGISDEQKTKLDAVRQESLTAMREAFQGGGPPDREEMQKLRKEADDKVLAVLSADQRSKLEKMKGKKVDFELNVFGRGGRGRRGGGAGGNQ